MSRRTETAYKAEPQGESAQHDEARPDLWGRVKAAVVQAKIMFLPGGEKHRFEREGRKPKLGFFVEQGGVTKKAASLSVLTDAVEQSLRRCALTWQKSAEDENPGFFPGKGPKAV